MKKIRLKVIQQPEEGLSTVFTKGDNGNKEPFLRSSGSYKLSCGFCDHILASGVEFSQINSIVFHCPRCNKYNISNKPITE